MCRFRFLLAGSLAASAVLVGASAGRASDDGALCRAVSTNPDQGIAACTRLIDKPPVEEGFVIADVFLRRGLGWSLKGDLPAAIRDFDEVVQRAPMAYVGYLNRGVARHRAGELDAAVRDFNQGIKLTSPPFPQPIVLATFYNGRGAVLNDQLEFDRAIGDFNRAIELHPSFAYAFHNRGYALHRKRLLDRAIADFSQVIRLVPNDPRGYSERAVVWIDKANFAQAIADCTAALKLDPKNQKALSCRGEAYRLTGDYERSVADHDAAIAIDPAAPAAWTNRGLVWRDKGELDRAIDDFSEAIVRDARHDPAYANRGEIYRLKDDLARSLADLNKAVSLNPFSPVALTLRGDTQRARGENERALADYNDALRTVKDYVAAFTGRGLAYEAQGNLAAARADFQKALSLPSDIDPEKAKPAQTLARVHLDAVVQAETEKAEAAKLALAQSGMRQADDRKNISAARAEAARLAATQIEAARAEMGRAAAAEIAAAKAEAARTAAAAKVEAEKAVAARLAALEAENAQATARMKGELARVQAAQLESAKAAPKRIVQADPGRRVALVIGNASYKSVGTLANPKRDAESVAATLKQIGFQSVRLINDASRMDFLSALKDFEDEADKADWAVIYYAGHGIQIGGENYLIPTDARLKADRDVPDESVSLGRILSTVTRARKLRVVILDACRDNPFEAQMRRASATRSLTRGLAPVEEPAGGTLVAFAAKAGQFAQDGRGGNSPFAAALLKHVVEPGIEVNMLFRRVRDDVLEATGRQQEPFTYGSLPGENFYFALN